MDKKPSLIDKFKDPNFKIARKGKWYAIAPLVIILTGLVIVLVINFNLGLDFTGGRTIAVTGMTDANYSSVENQVRNIMNDVRSENNAGRGWAFTIRREDGDAITMAVQFQDIGGLSVAQMNDLESDIGVRIEALLGGGVLGVENIGNISPAASQDHINRTFMAVALAIFAILIYMLIRFKFTSGVAAMIGLIHDVLVMMALVAIFRVQINSAFIAALITVVAYSINNTLILFDRIRGIEKMNENNETTEMMIDRGVKETFTRTMNTTITTLVPIFVLIIFGVPLIREFAVPILFGLIAGTFSTIFVTTSLYLRFENAKTAVKMKKKKKATT